MDGLVLTSREEHYKNIWHQDLKMKDLDRFKYYLEIEVSRSKAGISLSQRKYVTDLSTKTGMLTCKPVETPIKINHKLGEYEDHVPADTLSTISWETNLSISLSITHKVEHSLCSKCDEPIHACIN